jgi:YVTN family beta-propeller protein
LPMSSIPTGAGSRRLCTSHAGDRVYVANNKGDSVSAIDTLTKQLIATIPVGQARRELELRPTARRFTPPTKRTGQSLSSIAPR